MSVTVELRDGHMGMRYAASLLWFLSGKKIRGEHEGGNTRDLVSVLFKATAAIYGASALRLLDLTITRKGGNSVSH